VAFIEFQVSTHSFLNLLLVTRQQAKICPPQGIAIGGVSIVVDHFEFGVCDISTGAPGRQFINYEEFGVQKSEPINAPKTQIAQPVQIYATVLNDVFVHPNQPPANLLAVTVTAILDLNYYPIGPRCYLQVQYNSAEFGPLPPLPPGLDALAIQTQVAMLLPSLFPAPAIPFDFANSLSGASVNVENAGVSAGGNGSFLCFAAQLGAEFAFQADVFWTPFYAGDIADRRGNADFVVFFPKAYFELIVELTIESMLGDASGNSISFRAPAPTPIHLARCASRPRSTVTSISPIHSPLPMSKSRSPQISPSAHQTLSPRKFPYPRARKSSIMSWGPSPESYGLRES
jgi:hypothetical protein